MANFLFFGVKNYWGLGREVCLLRWPLCAFLESKISKSATFFVKKLFCELELNCFVNNALSSEIPPQCESPHRADLGGVLK